MQVQYHILYLMISSHFLKEYFNQSPIVAFLLPIVIKAITYWMLFLSQTLLSSLFLARRNSNTASYFCSSLELQEKILRVPVKQVLIIVALIEYVRWDRAESQKRWCNFPRKRNSWDVNQGNFSMISFEIQTDKPPICWVMPQMPITTLGGSSQSEEPRTQSWSPTSVSETQVLSHYPLPSMLAERGIRSTIRDLNQHSHRGHQSPRWLLNHCTNF